MRWLLPILILAMSASAEPPPTFDLAVELDGFRSGDGVAIITLYSAKKRWLKKSEANVIATVPLVRGEDGVVRAKHTFKALPSGRYAVGGVHDENKSGKLEMAWLPLPHPGEGIAASNNPKKGWLPPSWDQAVFPLKASAKLQLKLIYY